MYVLNAYSPSGDLAAVVSSAQWWQVDYEGDSLRNKGFKIEFLCDWEGEMRPMTGAETSSMRCWNED